MANNNSIGLDVNINADGFDMAAGTSKRKLTVTGADINLTGSGTFVYTLPGLTDNLLGRLSTDIVQNKTLNPANNIRLGPGTSSIVTNSAGIAGTETIVTLSDTAMPANRLVVGTTFRITLKGTCTSSVANVPTFAIKFGTAGTTADTTILSIPFAAAAASGTAIEFECEIVFTVRSIGTGTSGTIVGYGKLFNKGITGISTVQWQFITGSPTGFNTQLANTFLSATYKSAAGTTTCTFNNAFIEIVNL